ncbi:beta-glucanase (GH16 family) [Sphingomonas sp. SORGH_AS870]|uniref:glycoside hydrolase family 16 protein n=1 Tax=Sphingomonas sp. SORGH_AS_0870 TaxID=3041801 RepID=UPI002862A117|nr:glycoside hydrolase family 16 protein [Sphingomonas sp. SORGH_AS_0870]MDR6146917.1 beta-glucanase (GH16 family) [Sphingomonas sp. SORGH_AS_0870]
MIGRGWLVLAGVAALATGGAAQQTQAPVRTDTLGATNYGFAGPMTAPRTAPSFGDEFGRRIDPTRWRWDVSQNRKGWPNNELQYYAGPDRANARVEHGALVIEAKAEALRDEADWGGQSYSSAKLVTQKPLGYGFYEVRAKLPCGRGMWPAIWLLPMDGSRWPDGGEIDIMEMVGWNPDVIHATVHSAAYNHRLGTQRGAETPVPGACTAFHRYQLDWTPQAITIGVDGRAYMRVKNDRPGGAAAWPFTRPYSLILNLAVGGDWGGKKGVDDAALPQRMEVDYVRYWRR